MTHWVNQRNLPSRVTNKMLYHANLFDIVLMPYGLLKLFLFYTVAIYLIKYKLSVLQKLSKRNLPLYLLLALLVSSTLRPFLVITVGSITGT